MASFNFSTKQMAAKIVYYGPGLGGKTTSLKYIFDHTSGESRGKMVSLATETDRTLFFDLLPLEVGTVAGFKTRIQLYTVPGQVFYNSTRRLVLKGVDGVVFVADSQAAMLPANLESFRNLEVNLAELGISIEEIPLVLQYNKRDLEDICSIDELNEALNRNGWPEYETSAIEGDGVFEALREVSRLTLLSLKKQLESSSAPSRKPQPRAAAPAAQAPTAQEQPAAAGTGDEPSSGAAGEGPPAWQGQGAGPAAVPAAPNPANPEAAPATPEAPAPQAAPPAQPSQPAAPAEQAAAAPPQQAQAPTDQGDRQAPPEPEAPAPQTSVPAAPATPAPEKSEPAHEAAARNGHRDLDRSLDVELERDELAQAKTVAFDLQIRDGRQRVLHQLRDVEIELADLQDLESVRVQLQIALQARQSES